MTMQDVAKHLAALQRTLTVQIPLGTDPETYTTVSVSAYDAPPRSQVPAGNCPVFINAPVSENWRKQGSDDSAAAYEDIIWDCKLLVAHSMSETPEEIGALVFPFIDPVVNLLIAHTNLNQVQRLIQTEYQGHSGNQEIEQATEKFIGVVFRLMTSEWRVIPYASKE